MTQYLMSVYSGETADLSPEEIEVIYRDVDVFNEKVQSAGAWVFAGGLHPVDTATVVRVEGDDEVIMTDGPFTEAKEHLGGFWVIEAADLDAALAWAKEATIACRAPVEVRPFQDGPEE